VERKRTKHSQFFYYLIILVAVIFLVARIPIPLRYILSYLAALAFVVFIPGLVLSYASGSRSLEETITLGAVLGLTVSSVMYFLFSIIGMRQAFLIWPLSMSVLLLYIVARKKPLRGALVVGKAKLEAAVITLSPLYILAFFGFYDNGLYEAGLGLRLTFTRDALFHSALVYGLEANLKNPATPWISGICLNYHFFMDLFSLVIHELSDVPIFLELIKLNQTFLLILLVFTSYVSTHYIFHSKGIAFLNTAMTLFGGCATGVIPGILFLGLDKQWDVAFHTPTMPGLYYVNSQILALSMFYIFLFTISKYLVEKRLVFLILTSFFFAIEVECKVFIVIVAIPALLITGLFKQIRHKDSSFLKVLFAVLISSVPLLLIHFLLNRVGAQQNISLDLGGYLVWSLRFWGLFSVADWTNTIFSSIKIMNLILGIVLLVTFATAGMGYRMLSLPAIFRRKDVIDGNPGLRLYLSLMTLIGLVLFLSLKVTPKDFPYAYNNSSWFAVAGLNAANLLAAREAFFMLKKRRLHKKIFASVFLFLSLLVSIQSFYLYGTFSIHLEPELYEALTYLQANSSPTDVVVVNCTWSNYQSLYIPSYISSIAGRPVVLSIGEAMQFASRCEIESRVNDINYLYRNPRKSSHILDKYNISFVWVEKGPNSNIDVVVREFGQDFTVFYKGKDFAILRVHRTNVDNQPSSRHSSTKIIEGDAAPYLALIAILQLLAAVFLSQRLSEPLVGFHIPFISLWGKTMATRLENKKTVPLNLGLALLS